MPPTKIIASHVNGIRSSLEPSRDQYADYLESTKWLLDLASVPVTKRGNGIQAMSLRKSRLFPKQSFLVAWLAEGAFRRFGPGCDAVAVVDLPMGSLRAPPLVIIPESRKASRSTEFISILEHEFVHVCQAIRGRFPDVPSGDAWSLLENFYLTLRAEYEVNLLQLHRWPKLYADQRSSWPLREWCTLRGYTQALESILHSGSRFGVSSDEITQLDEITQFLDVLPSSLERGFSQIGIHRQAAPYFSHQLRQHVQTAMELLLERDAGFKSHESFVKIRAWITK